MQPETYKHYWEKGWAVEEGVFSREEADRIAQVAARSESTGTEQ